MWSRRHLAVLGLSIASSLTLSRNPHPGPEDPKKFQGTAPCHLCQEEKTREVFMLPISLLFQGQQPLGVQEADESTVFCLCESSIFWVKLGRSWC